MEMLSFKVKPVSCCLVRTLPEIAIYGIFEVRNHLISGIIMLVSCNAMDIKSNIIWGIVGRIC